MTKPNGISCSTGILARLFSGLGIIAVSLFLVPLVGADVLDGSLKVRLNFDAAPVGTVVADTSPR